MEFQFLDNPEYWLSAVVLLVVFKILQMVFYSVLEYIKDKAIEEYKREHKDE